MDSGTFLTYWTIRLAVACYVASILLQTSRHRRAARWLWTAGVALLFVHVACAMHFVHRWDHARMVAETARQAAELTGVHWNGGAYLNYVFMAVWAADAVYWWAAGDDSYRRRATAVTIMLHAFMAFIAVNAVIVFPKTAWVRWAGVAAAVWVVWRWVRTRRERIEHA